MAYSKDNMDIVGAKGVAPTNVKGNTMAHSDLRKQSGYKSKEIKGWKKVEVPEGQHFAERKRSGTDVPKPPVLDLP